MDLQSLRKQFQGRRFGELVLHHHKSMDLAKTMAALRDTMAALGPVGQTTVEGWIDGMNANARSEAFWRLDCGAAFEQITAAGAAKLRAAGVEPSSDDVFNMFQIIVLNFAYAAHRHPESKAFIQKSVGVGFLRRLFSRADS